MLGFGLVFLTLGAAVSLRRPRWLLVTVIVVVVVQLAGSVPFLVSNLAHPESPLSFVMEAFGLLAGLTAVVGAVGALRGVGPRVRRPMAVGAVGLAGVALLGSLVAAAGVEHDLAQPGDTLLEVDRSQYPERVDLPAGPTTLRVDNRDPIRHTLVVEGTDVHVELPASTAVRMDTDLEAGTYRYYCDVPGHESMEGELAVR